MCVYIYIYLCTCHGICLAEVPEFPFPAPLEVARRAARVKSLQKSSRAASKSWHDYVRAHNMSSLDPARHKSQFLDAFLDSFEPCCSMGGCAPMADAPAAHVSHNPTSIVDSASMADAARANPPHDDNNAPHANVVHCPSTMVGSASMADAAHATPLHDVIDAPPANVLHSPSSMDGSASMADAAQATPLHDDVAPSCEFCGCETTSSQCYSCSGVEFAASIKLKVYEFRGKSRDECFSPDGSDIDEAINSAMPTPQSAPQDASSDNSSVSDVGLSATDVDANIAAHDAKDEAETQNFNVKCPAEMLKYLQAQGFRVAERPLVRDYAQHWSANGGIEHVHGECTRHNDFSTQYILKLACEASEFGLFYCHTVDNKAQFSPFGPPHPEHTPRNLDSHIGAPK